MFDQLDNTLTELIKAAPTGATFDNLKLVGDNISFVAPDRTYTPPQVGEINLFLFETKENRELRDPLPIMQMQNGMCTRRRSTLRVDCTYMVTAWWADGKNESEKVTASHRLLGQIFNWLSRFPVISEQYLMLGGMSGQVFAPPTMVAQMDGAKSAGEFWHALGIPPRPYFNLVVTITMDLDQKIEESLVTTVTTNYHGGNPAASEERVIIGGTVRDSGGHVVPDAWVRLDPLGITQVTNASGQFIFDRVVSGTGFSLRARSPGLGETPMRSINIPSYSGEYDLQFP